MSILITRHPLYPRRRGLTANTRYESAKISNCLSLSTFLNQALCGHWYNDTASTLCYRADGNLTRARTLWLDHRNRHSRSAPKTALAIYTGSSRAYSGQQRHGLSEIRRWRWWR
uniref:Uncharacterized protein n=1 Tax=Trichogramma kaykai TaxID=54128 RepID=A0ABD2VVK5_9HYME